MKSIHIIGMLISWTTICDAASEMTVFLIDTLDGDRSVDISSEATVADLRTAAGTKRGVLWFHGTELTDNGMPLSDIGVCAESVVQVTAAPPVIITVDVEVDWCNADANPWGGGYLYHVGHAHTDHHRVEVSAPSLRGFVADLRRQITRKLSDNPDTVQWTMHYGCGPRRPNDGFMGIHELIEVLDEYIYLAPEHQNSLSVRALMNGVFHQEEQRGPFNPGRGFTDRHVTMSVQIAPVPPGQESTRISERHRRTTCAVM